MTTASHRWPILPTLLVAAAVLTMIGLGIWQLRRADEKAALLALFERNAAMSQAVALPTMGPIPADAMYRMSSANCLRVVGWREVGGRSADGRQGYRHLADCSAGVEGPGFVADLGLAEDAGGRPRWNGGPVQGMITEEPVAGGLWASLRGTRPVPRPMLVATRPVGGLIASAPPDPSAVPNSHMAYALQWFFFAAAAATIYVLALRSRWRKADAPPPPPAPPANRTV